MSNDRQSPPPSAGRIRWACEAGVGTITIENPGKHNAISLAMWRTLCDALAAFEADAAVRCVVIRGDGDQAFCAGADIAEKQGVEAAQAQADLQVGMTGLKALNDFSKPLMAMISGYCLGAGTAIALCCDLRIAGSGARFGIPAARLGLAYQYSEIKRLVDVVGPAQARQILFTADRVPAERALQIGLVNELVPDGELKDFVMQMAARIAANAPLTIAAAKHAVALAISEPAGRDLGGCQERTRACFESEDYAEGRRAFREKRQPVFKGR